MVESKKKAIELVEKYESTITSVLGDRMKHQNAVKCAILEVESILEALDLYRRMRISTAVKRCDLLKEVLTELKAML